MAGPWTSLLVLLLLFDPVAALPEEGPAPDAPAGAEEGADGKPGILEAVALFVDRHAWIDTGPGDGRLRIGALRAADLVLWDRRNARASGLEGGRAEVRLDAFLRDLRGRVAVDLLGEDTPHHLAEAWAGWEPEGGVHARLGLQRLALGTEGATESCDLPLPGRGFAALLDARTDLALRVDAASPGGLLWGEAAAFSGNGFLPDGTRVGSPGAQVRAVVHPFRAGERSPGEDGRERGALEWVFLGGGLAWLADFEDPLVLQNPLGSTVLRTRDLEGREGRRLHLEAGAALGPVALGLEWTDGSAGSVAVPGGGRSDVDEIAAWSASLAWRITGEPQAWERGAWRRAAPARAGGLWEVAVRYANADIDRNLFRHGTTTYDPSSQETRTFSAMLGWRPRENVRVALGWVVTLADESLTTFGAGPGPRSAARAAGDGRDSSFLLRLEIAF